MCRHAGRRRQLSGLRVWFLHTLSKGLWSGRSFVKRSPQLLKLPDPSVLVESFRAGGRGAEESEKTERPGCHSQPVGSPPSAPLCLNIRVITDCFMNIETHREKISLKERVLSARSRRRIVVCFRITWR